MGRSADANVFVDCLEEEQQLAANQTIVTFSHVTTTGLAIYIDGERISNKTGANGWQATSATDILLGKSYPAGSVILGVQNDPLGSAPYPLAQSQNLADLKNKTLARTNLGVFSKEETRANGLQPGAIVYFAMNKAPIGYLKANGAAVSRTAYAELFAEIGTLYGAGDGVTTFNLPDGRAEFIRGLDDGRGIDAGRAIGSKQSQQVQSTSIYRLVKLILVKFGRLDHPPKMTRWVRMVVWIMTTVTFTQTMVPTSMMLHRMLQA